MISLSFSAPAGVTEIQYRRAMASIQKLKDQVPRRSEEMNENSSSVMDAAALQVLHECIKLFGYLIWQNSCS